MATLNGDQRSYKDVNLSPDETHTYKITTYTSGVSTHNRNWGTHESVGASVTGSTKSSGMVVSQGEFTNRVKITWVDLSVIAENIRIMRTKPGVAPSSPVQMSQLEELEILNKNATAYNDYEAIPGYNYTYYIFPVAAGRTFTPSRKNGYRKRNGLVKGYVKS
ncbi:MAG: hypothetical protein ACO1OF_06395 [Adhaeribacter sp.]